jgi:asparagine synthase (glutamine-hydrolysing)
MNTYSNKQLKTFTIGLKDKKYDESVFAKKIANYLGTEHHEFQISEKDMLNQISNILSIYDEPFADSSQIPTSILSRFAKKEVSVILTGDGGDEIFGGYNRYIWAENLWKKIYWIPPKLRSIVAKLFLNIPLYLWSPLLSILYLFKSNTLKVSQLEDKIYKISMKLRNTKNFMDLYFSLITEWKDYDELFIDKSYNYKDIFNNQFENINLNNTEIMMSNDSLTYLPDDILYKVDRSAMSYGLETRVPFLDTEVTKLAWRVPISEKIDQKNKKGKTILRNLLNEYMPSNLYDRSKMGFSIPLANWIKNGLREFTFDNLNSINIKNDGYFDHKVVQKFLDEHMSGKRNWQYKLWSIIVFQNWLSNRKT